MESELFKIVKIILLVILPPLGLYFYVGFNKDFWIDLLLTLLGYLPGLVYAIYIVSRPELHVKR